MEYYLLRQTDNVLFEISKFNSDYKSPLDKYEVRKRDDKVTCSCPAGWRKSPCKHTKLFKYWQKDLNGEYGYYFTMGVKATNIQYHFLFNPDLVKNDLYTYP